MARVILLALILLIILLGVRSITLHIRGALGQPGADSPEPRTAEEEDIGTGAFLHRVLMDAYGAEREAWALERVARVEQRLQADRPAGERLAVEILWIPECNAFTGPGRWVYVSRRLLERCKSDDALAMIVSHEIAHHDLGHPGTGDLLWVLERLMSSPEMEAEADAHGFNLCIAAGYDPKKCLSLFDILEDDSLDWGDRAGVFGSDAEIDAALADEPEWRRALERWVHTRRRGYLPIRDRKSALWSAYIAARGSGGRPDPG
jgi:predicted Zn-dependent protease